MHIHRFAALVFVGSLAFAQTATDQLQKLFADYHEDSLRDDPTLATGVGRHEYNHRWQDWSKEQRDRRSQKTKDYLKRLEAVPLDGVSEQDRLSADLLRYILRDRLENEAFHTHLMRVSQMTWGLHNSVYRAIDRMPKRNGKDYENIIARLAAVPVYVVQNLEILNEAIRSGYLQPRVVVDRLEAQLRTQISQPAQTTPLLAAFSRFPSTVPPDEQQRLRTTAIQVYEGKFLPSWRKLHDYIVNVYAPKTGADVGLSSIPNGHAMYSYAIRFWTTVPMSAEEIHKIGVTEVDRIEREIVSEARKLGLSGSLAEIEPRLKGPEHRYRDKEEMLTHARSIAKLIEPELPRLFSGIPRLLYGIRPIPEDIEASMATNAEAPTADLSRPGWVNLNTYRPTEQFKNEMEALILHEGVPGHVFQGAIARQLTTIPEFRKSVTAGSYSEGWGLYAESLGSELGLYRDPYTRIGRLNLERGRAVRLVVDTGLHALGWTRARALDYFTTHAPTWSPAEIDRYISSPGQALAYKIGELRIRQLRAMAEKELGTRFDVREFHDVVLRNGRLPLTMLEEQVKKYIAETGRRPTGK